MAGIRLTKEGHKAYHKELKNVLLDAKATSELITKAQDTISKAQEALEEMDGINIMLIEHTRNKLKGVM